MADRRRNKKKKQTDGNDADLLFRCSPTILEKARLGFRFNSSRNLLVDTQIELGSVSFVGDLYESLTTNDLDDLMDRSRRDAGEDQEKVCLTFFFLFSFFPSTALGK